MNASATPRASATSQAPATARAWTAESAEDDRSSDLGDHIRLAVGRVFRRFRSERPDGALGDAALTVLTRLHKDGARSLTQLSEQQGVALATMSEVVNRLTAAGLAVRARDHTDRRRVLLSATPEGDRVAEAARAQRHAWLDARLAALDPAERDLLDRAAGLLIRIAAD